MPSKGAAVLLIEDPRDLSFGVVVEQLVDGVDQLARSAPELIDRGWERQGERVRLPAFEADVRGDLLVAA